MATEVMNFTVTWEKIFAQTLFSSHQCDYFHHSKMISLRFYMANVTWRVRTRREKRKLQKDSIRGIFQLREEEGTFAFSTIPAGASSSSILQLFVLPQRFC